MKKAKFSSRIKEAQVIYVLAFSDKPIQTNFVDKLVKCFSKNQTDEQLIGGIILGIIIVIIMPVIAVISIFNGDINLNTDELQQIVEQMKSGS